MSTETTNKKIRIDNGTTFGRTYTDKAVDELLKNASGKLDIVKVTYDTVNSKVTADVANKPDGTYVVDIILKTDDTEVNLGTKIGLIEIGSLVDIDSGDTIRTLSGYGYLNDLMFIEGTGAATDTSINITDATLARIPTHYSINGLVKIKSDGTLGSVRVPDQEQSDSFLVYDRTVGNYDWRPVSEIDNKTISLFGKHSILVPKNSADTNILPCTPSDNGKVLSVVNGEASWATPTSSGGTKIIVARNRYFNFSIEPGTYSRENPIIKLIYFSDVEAIINITTEKPYEPKGDVYSDDIYWNVIWYADGNNINSVYATLYPTNGEHIVTKATTASINFRLAYIPKA